jgi:hypothetical protein
MPWPFLFGAGMAAFKSNLPQYVGGAMMGLGYTSGAYTGYGVSNTVDPIGIHRSKSYKGNHIKLIRMAYGMSGYGRYRRRNTGYRRYRRYGRYSRFYRRRRPYYRRSYY